MLEFCRNVWVAHPAPSQEMMHKSFTISLSKGKYYDKFDGVSAKTRRLFSLIMAKFIEIFAIGWQFLPKPALGVVTSLIISKDSDSFCLLLFASLFYDQQKIYYCIQVLIPLKLKMLLIQMDAAEILQLCSSKKTVSGTSSENDNGWCAKKLTWGETSSHWHTRF